MSKSKAHTAAHKKMDGSSLENIIPKTEMGLERFEFFRPAATAVVFGLSILIAFWNPIWAMVFWGALLPISSINGPRSARF